MLLAVGNRLLCVLYTTGVAICQLIAAIFEILCQPDGSRSNNNNHRHSIFSSTMLPAYVSNTTAVTTAAAGMPPFRANNDDWLNWKDLLESHFAEFGVHDDEKKVAVLLKHVGLQAYGMLKGLCNPVLPANKKYEELCTLLQQQYSKPVILFRERQNFYAAHKKDTETVAAWYARLKDLALTCKFGANLDVFVLNKFVTGSTGKLFEKLCEDDERLTLEEALKKAMIFETKMSPHQQQQRANTVSGSFDRVQFVSRKRGKPHGNKHAEANDNNGSNKGNQDGGAGGNKKTEKCSHCGYQHLSKDCKFKDATCRRCNKKGHISTICSQQVNLVQQEDQSGVEDNAVYSNNAMSGTTDYFSNVSIFSIFDEAASVPFTVSILVQRVPVEFVWDSGSPVSFISMNDFVKLFGKTQLRPCTNQYRTYDGTAIKICGEFNATVRYQYSDSRSPPLLGRDFMRAFNVGLPVFSIEENANSLEKVTGDLKCKFAKVFEDGLGKFTSHTVKLELKDGAKPVFCKPRHVPLALRESVDKQLKQLIDMGVLVQVNCSDWATPLVPVLKSDGNVRICGDYKSTINPFLADVIYPLPRRDFCFA